MSKFAFDSVPAGLKRLSGSRRVMTALLSCVLLAACAEDKFEQQHSSMLTLEERHPIKIEQQPIAMELPVAPGTRQLSGGQLGQVSAFLADYKTKGQGSLIVRVPTGTSNATAARSAANDIRLAVAQQGIAPGMVRFQAYRNAGKGKFPPVVMSYNATVAVGPECGVWDENVTANPNNRPYADFGCATQRNLASMIANPNDLVQARTMTPRSAPRNDTIYVKYVKGDATVAKQTAGDVGTGSGVGQ